MAGGTAAANDSTVPIANPMPNRINMVGQCIFAGTEKPSVMEKTNIMAR